MTLTTATPAPHMRRLANGAIDGRNLRSADTRARILRAARTLVMMDRRWPTGLEIARAAQTSTRNVWQHFDGVPALMLAALTDADCERLAVRLREMTDRELVEVALTARLP